MTKLFTRKPHPARRARIATATVSSSAFLAIISSFAWNSHIAELAASSTPIPNEIPAAPVAPAAPATTATVPATATPTAPAAQTPAAQSSTVSKKPAATTSKPAKTKKAKAKAKKAKAATATKPSTTTPTTAPAAPAAPTVVYSCVSPGGKTEKPTASGKCKNARYGYVLTKV